MFLLRLVLIPAAIALILLMGTYVLTNDRRYLRYARQLVRFMVFALLNNRGFIRAGAAGASCLRYSLNV
jgi:uncharacterized protein YyaL (SSP411 family)